MDINKIQKLNDMALNLKKHNIGYSQEAAIKQAENLYGTENNFSHEAVRIVDDSSDDLKKDVRKLTFALRDAITEIKDLKEHVGKLQQELNDVRVNNVPKRVQPSQSQINTGEIAQEGQQRLTPTNEAHVPKKDLNQPIDRNGISPNDVAIDKFFYFGTK